jgi:hypothetical protein
MVGREEGRRDGREGEGAPGRELSGEEGVPVGWEAWGGGAGLGEMRDVRLSG